MATVAAFGKVVREQAYSSDDGRRMGAVVLDHTAGHSSIPELGKLAASAAALSREPITSYSANHAEAAAFELIAAPPTLTLPALQSELAARAMKNAYSSNDQRKIGAFLLAQIAAGGASAEVARYAQQAAGLPIQDQTAKALEEAAFERIARGSNSDPVEKEIEAVARAGMAGAYSSDDRAIIANGLLDRYEASTDLRVKTLAGFARALTTAGGAETGGAVSHQVFDASTGKTPPGRDKVHLYNRLALGGSILGMVGVVGAVATASPIAGVVAGAGALIFAGALAMSARAGTERILSHRGNGSLQMSYEIARIMADSAAQSEASLRRTYDAAQKMATELDARISVHQIGLAIHTAPDPNARITVEDHAVQIGKLRIPRKS